MKLLMMTIKDNCTCTMLCCHTTQPQANFNNHHQRLDELKPKPKTKKKQKKTKKEMLNAGLDPTTLELLAPRSTN